MCPFSWASPCDLLILHASPSACLSLRLSTSSYTSFSYSQVPDPSLHPPPSNSPQTPFLFPLPQTLFLTLCLVFPPAPGTPGLRAGCPSHFHRLPAHRVLHGITALNPSLCAALSPPLLPRHLWVVLSLWGCGPSFCEWTLMLSGHPVPEASSCQGRASLPLCKLKCWTFALQASLTARAPNQPGSQHRRPPRIPEPASPRAMAAAVSSGPRGNGTGARASRAGWGVKAKGKGSGVFAASS